MGGNIVEKMLNLKLVVAVYLMLMDVMAQPYTTLQQNELTMAEFHGCCDATCDNPNGPYYYRYLVPSKRDDNILYVGAMNFLFKLNKADLTCLKQTMIKPEPKVSTRCAIQGKSEELDCHNHIRVIMEIKDQELYVCGTGAYKPSYYSINETTFNVTGATEVYGKGYGICPHDPLDNATSILIDNGNPGNATVPYFGTYTDFIKNSPVFYRSPYTIGDVAYSSKGTDREDINWLNLPQFVGSFDERNEVYTFFRETAVEYPARANKIYSRVAKVCKGDLGGGYMSKKKWLSFVKARLVCSFPGNAPYYFDEIYDIYKSGDLYFGLFYKQGFELNVSAICVFSKDDIEAAFNGKFKYKNTAGQWVTLPDNLNPNPRLDNCELHDTNPEIFDTKTSVYQLMDTNIDSMHKRPIFYKNGVQLMRLLVGEAFNGSRNIYAASDKGEIHDIFMKSYTSHEPTVLLNAIYEPFGPDSYPLWDLKLQDNEIYMGTDYRVGKLNLDDVCKTLDKVDSCFFNTRCKWCIAQGFCRTSNYQCRQSIDHNVVEANKGVLQILMDANVLDPNLQTQPVPAITGSYFRLVLQSMVRVSDVIWTKTSKAENRNTRSAQKQDILSNSEKYAKSATGDLIIRNVTESDGGIYTAYSLQSDTPLAAYDLDVKNEKNRDELIAIWQQQFNDWSSAFSQWKHCSKDYFETCQNSP